jgi:hypothetical protein
MIPLIYTDSILYLCVSVVQSVASVAILEKKQFTTENMDYTSDIH